MARKLRLLLRHHRLLLESLAVVSLVRIALTLFGYRWVRRKLGPNAGARPFVADPHESGGDGASARVRATVDLIVWSVRQASRIVPGASCLTQAIAGQSLLERRGEASTIRIGVRRAAGDEFQAHAWLVHDGRTVLGGHAQPGPAFKAIADMVSTRG